MSSWMDGESFKHQLCLRFVRDMSKSCRIGSTSVEVISSDTVGTSSTSNISRMATYYMCFNTAEEKEQWKRYITGAKLHVY